MSNVCAFGFIVLNFCAFFANIVFVCAKIHLLFMICVLCVFFTIVCVIYRTRDPSKDMSVRKKDYARGGSKGSKADRSGRGRGRGKGSKEK